MNTSVAGATVPNSDDDAHVIVTTSPGAGDCTRCSVSSVEPSSRTVMEPSEDVMFPRPVREPMVGDSDDDTHTFTVAMSDRAPWSSIMTYENTDSGQPDRPAPGTYTTHRSTCVNSPVTFNASPGVTAPSAGSVPGT